MDLSMWRCEAAHAVVVLKEVVRSFPFEVGDERKNDRILRCVYVSFRLEGESITGALFSGAWVQKIENRLRHL